MLEYYPKWKKPKCELPNNDWYSAWQKRNSMTNVNERILEDERAKNGSVGNIKDWFDRIGKEIDFSQIDKHMIGNLDETMLSTKTRTLVCVKKGTKLAESIDTDLHEHVTILTLIVNGGTIMKPLFVYQLKTLPNYFDDLMKTNKLMVAGQKKGWITESTFGDYMVEFMKWLPEYRKQIGVPPNSKFVLFSDSHGSRKDGELMNQLKLANVYFVTFPSHCTHILQPLDVGIFASFKKYLRQEKRRFKRVSLRWNGDVPSEAGIKRVIETMAAVEALHISCSPMAINNSFMHTGLYPFDVERALLHPRITPNEEVTINNRKRKVIHIDNLVVTNEDTIKLLQEEEAKTPNKPKSKKLYKYSILFLEVKC